MIVELGAADGAVAGLQESVSVRVLMMMVAIDIGGKEREGRHTSVAICLRRLKGIGWKELSVQVCTDRGSSS